MVTGQLADMPTRALTSHGRGLENSQTGQLADADSNFACLVSSFWPLTDVLLHVYLKIYYASDSVSCIICPHSLIMQLKQ